MPAVTEISRLGRRDNSELLHGDQEGGRRGAGRVEDAEVMRVVL